MRAQAILPKRAFALLLCLCCAVAAAAESPRSMQVELQAELQRLAARAPENGLRSEPRQLARAALELAGRGKLQEASQRMNAALQLEASNSWLQFFNAFIYHLQAQGGDSAKIALAEQGYKLALRFDASNWIAQHFLGLLYFEQRNFAAAQRAFAEVLLFREDDPQALKGLVAAAYYAGDAGSAAAALSRLRQQQPDDAQLLRLAAILDAALGRAQEAQDSLARLERGGAPAAEVAATRARLAQWARIHAQGQAEMPRMVKTQSTEDEGAAGGARRANIPNAPLPQMGGRIGGNAAPLMLGRSNGMGMGGMGMDGEGMGMGMGGAMPGAAGGNGASLNGAGAANLNGMQGGFGGNPYGMGGMGGMGMGGFGGMDDEGMGMGGMPMGGAPRIDTKATRMVLVDVVILRTEDSLSTQKGLNLLSALTLQFGDATNAAFAHLATRTTSGEAANYTSTLTRAISIPALSYSLNIANANTNLNEVLARPTLAALEGVKSDFFSGTTLNAAVVSSGTSSAGGAVQLEKEIGVKLSILPVFLPDNRIRLAVDAQRTFLKPPSQDVAFTYKVEVSKTMVNANVVMDFGESLILGGLSEKESSNSRDGVPLLQDVPGLQYLFSKRNTSDFQRSVLILITPRRPQYTYRPEEVTARAKRDGEETDSMKELRARYGDWFKPYPNTASVFNHLNLASLYREFRTGDVTLERWDKQATTIERLHQAFEFLFY